MAGEKMTQAIQGAQAFVSAMDAKDWLAWFTFDDRIYPRTQGLKSETGVQLLSDIRSTTAFGGTALYDAVLARDFNTLANKRRTREELVRYGIVILSDSGDTSSATTWTALEAKSQSRFRKSC